MKAISYLKYILRVAVLVAVVSMLPGFTKDVAADTLPDGISITRSDGSDAVPDEDYTLAENVLTLKIGGLTISGDEECWLPYQIYDAIDSGAHTYTIKNLTIDCSSNGVNGLFLNSTYDKFLNVEGNCTIKVSGATTGIFYSNTLNITGSEGSRLTIERIGDGSTYGINGNNEAGSNNSIYFQGPPSGNPFMVDIKTPKLAIGAQYESGNVLSVDKNTEVICNGNLDNPSGLVSDYKRYAINGKLFVNNESPASTGSALTLYNGDTVSVGSDASVLLRSSGGAAINSWLSTPLSKDSFGEKVLARGSEDYDAVESSINGELTGSSDFPSKSAIVDGGIAKTVLIAGCYTVTLKDLYDDPQREQKVFKNGYAEAPTETPVDPDGSGTFSGKWYSDEDRSKEWDFDNKTVTEDITLYPEYEYDEYTVKFHSNGGSPASIPDVTVTKEDYIHLPQGLTRDGYTLSGWYFDEGYEHPYDRGRLVKPPVYPVGGVVNLYAEWTYEGPGANIVVRFNSMGGSEVPSQVIEGCPVKAEEPPDPTKEGYKFAGWYTDEKYTTKFDFDDWIEKDITLYAKWDGSGKHKSDKEEKKSTEVEYIDRDTFKSEYPGGTVLSINLADANQFYDMKVHSSDAQTVTNQELLSTLLLGADAKAVITRDVYMRSDLPTYEDGELRVLKWKNLPINTAGTVRAVVYNTVDGAYVIDGVVDATGTAAFTGFKLRPASTITICK